MVLMAFSESREGLCALPGGAHGSWKTLEFPLLSMLEKWLRGISWWTGLGYHPSISWSLSERQKEKKNVSSDVASRGQLTWWGWLTVICTDGWPKTIPRWGCLLEAVCTSAQSRGLEACPLPPLPPAKAYKPLTSEASWEKGGGMVCFQHVEEKKRNKINCVCLYKYEESYVSYVWVHGMKSIPVTNWLL